jgi:hypothetical protein
MLFGAMHEPGQSFLGGPRRHPDGNQSVKILRGLMPLGGSAEALGNPTKMQASAAPSAFWRLSDGGGAPGRSFGATKRRLKPIKNRSLARGLR